MSKPTIVFTGGHHNSSLVVAKQLHKTGYKVAWIGHKYTISGDKKVSAEYEEVTRAGLPFYELKTGKIYRKINPLEYLKVTFGFIQAFNYLIHIRPKLIVSFGGYLSVPVVIAGWLLHIPSVTHEQTATTGWANRVVAKFAKKIFLTHQSSITHFPKSKTVLTGLPLRHGLLDRTKVKVTKPPLLYITCGKQGSHIINQAVFPLVPELVKHFKLVHQTGAHTHTPDQDKSRRIKASLPPKLRSRYITKGYFFETEATKYLRSASLIVSRAGAHTTYEIMLLGKRAVMIPIPWVSHNEQLKNAQLVSDLGLGVILNEDDLTPQNLNQAIHQALKLKAYTNQHQLPTNATEIIIQEIMPFLQ